MDCFAARGVVGAVPPRTLVLLIAPYAPCGGGMGRIMAYLSGCGAQAGVQFEMVESRGGGRALWSGWHATRAAFRCIAVAVRQQPAIVHLAFGDGGSFARKGLLLLLADALGLPTILHLHAADLDGFYRRSPPAARALLAHVVRRAHHCIVLGPAWRAWLAEKCRVPPARVTIIRNGVPQPVVDRARPGGAVFTFAFVGNLLPRKGLPVLLEALASVRHKACWPGRDWRLLVAGGGDARALEASCAALRIADAVSFRGWLDRAATTALLAQSDAIVLPSYHEAMPLVLLEAASLGLAVIATRVGAVPEIFTDGQDALLLAPGDAEGLGAVLARLLTDASLATRLGENARLLHQRSFGMDDFAAAVGGVYRHVGAGRA